MINKKSVWNRLWRVINPPSEDELAREMMDSIREGNTEALEELLKKAPRFVNYPLGYHITPLHSAAEREGKYHAKEVVEILLRHGADPWARTSGPSDADLYVPEPCSKDPEIQKLLREYQDKRERPIVKYRAPGPPGLRTECKRGNHSGCRTWPCECSCHDWN